MASGLNPIEKIDLGNGRSVTIARGWATGESKPQPPELVWFYVFSDEVSDEQIVGVNRQLMGLGGEAVSAEDFRAQCYDLGECLHELSQEDEPGMWAAICLTGHEPLAERLIKEIENENENPSI